MYSIKINYQETDDDLFGKSKFWGQADLPEGMAYPMMPYDDEFGDDPLTFVCQFRCSDLAPYDTDNLLPHKGILYFFAAIDSYVGALREDDYEDDNIYHNGMGEWSEEAFRVLYSPTEEGLHTHTITGEDGEPYNLPAEKITFEACDSTSLDTKLLGRPFEIEVEQEFPDHISLLQLWEEDRWCFFMYDCGIINFLITSEDLKALRFDRVKVYLHSC